MRRKSFGIERGEETTLLIKLTILVWFLIMNVVEIMTHLVKLGLLKKFQAFYI